MKVPIQRLRAEIRSDRDALARHLDDLASLKWGGEDAAGAAARAAVALHHAYGSVESALTRVARQLEGSLPEGADWHQALLDSMALEIEGVRPRVLSPETQSGLRRLLAFRHFFRHAYAVVLDEKRLADLRDQAIAVRPALNRDLDALDAFLSMVASQSE